MTETTRSTSIDASPQAVWAILEDVRRMPELSPSTESVDAPPRLAAVGDRFDQTVRVGGRRLTSAWTVTAIDPGRCLAITGKVAPGTSYDLVERIEPEGRGTRLTLTMRWRLPFGPLGRLAGRLGVERRALSEATDVLDGVRRLAEAG